MFTILICDDDKRRFELALNENIKKVEEQGARVSVQFSTCAPDGFVWWSALIIVEPVGGGARG